MSYADPIRSRFSNPAPLLARCCAAALALTACAPSWSQSDPVWNALGPAGGSITVLLASPSNPSVLYAGTPENGVFVSGNGGLTWSAANAGLAGATVAGRRTLYAIHALASDGRYVYAATDAGLFYAPAGSNASWAALASTASPTPITILAFEPTAGRLYAASGQTDGSAPAGVYVTTIPASGAPSASWTFTPLPGGAGLPVGALTVVPAQGGVTSAALLASVAGNLYVGSIAPTGVALNWASADSAGSLTGGSIDALGFSADFGLAYACSASTLFYSGNPLDPQPVWLPATVASAPAFSCKAFATVPIAVGGAPQVMLGTDVGAFVSVDGVSFVATGSLGPGPLANSFAVATAPGSASPNLSVASSSGVQTTAVASLAGGATWTPSNGPASVGTGASNLRLTNANVVDTAVVGGTLFAAVTGADYAEVFASTDGGSHWVATAIATLLNPGEQLLGLTADATNDVLFAATTQGLFAFNTVGVTWAAVGATTIVGRASALALGASRLFVATDNGIFAAARGKSPAAATPSAVGLTGQSVRSLLVANATIYAGTIDSNDENFVFSASEAGASSGTAVWTAFATGSAGTDRISSLLLVSNTLLAATQGSLVLYATAGSGWASANVSGDPVQRISDPFGIVNHLFADSAFVYASTGSKGIYVSPVGSTFAWTAFVGAGSTALPASEVHTVHAANGFLYAATRAGVASTASPSAVGNPVPVVPAPPAADSGGGAFEPVLAVLLLAATFALRRRRR